MDMNDRPSLRVVNETVSLRERTTNVLRNAILNQTFKPGEKLVERRLCEETGVSRTSIRESLRILEAEGLVCRESGRGLCVNRVTTQEVRDMYGVRRMLEGPMLRKICEDGDPKHIMALRAAIKKLSAFDDPKLENAPVEHAKALGEVSRCIAEGAGNQVARDILVSLSARMTYFRSFVSRSATAEERKVTMGLLNRIADAVADRNADEAETAFYNYIDRATDRAIALSSQVEDS